MSGHNFKNVHQDYAAMAGRWIMAHDFWRGGKWVLEPGHLSSFYYTSRAGVSQTPELDSGIARSSLGAEWFRADSSAYLWKHASESTQEYEERCARAVHIPVFSRVIDIYSAGILRAPPKRENAAAWAGYHADVDLAGTDYDAFISDALNLALAFGRVHAITDVVPLEGDAPITMGDQLRSGIRPYTYLVTPLSLVDWALDDRGRFLWAVIAESSDEQRAPGERQKKSRMRYRVWTRDGWTLWTETEKRREYAPIAQGKHNVGEVPIATLWTSRSKAMACESPFADVLDGDRRLFNKYSELDTLERYCGFPVLAIPEAPDKQTGPLDLGPARAFTYDSGAGGSPSWLSPDPTHARDGWSRLLEQIFAFRFTSGASRSQERSLEERGAAAISAESEDKRNMMSRWASAVEEFDAATHRHGAKWIGADEPKRATYTRNFDLRAIASQINDVVQLASAKAVAGPTMAALVKPIVAKILAEHGEDKAQIAAALKAIDGEANKLEPKPALPPQPPPGSSFSGAMERAERPSG